MISRTLKDLYYKVAGPVMRANGAVYKAFRAPGAGVVKAHLGPGQKRYLPGWINVDANIFSAKCDVWADLRNPLPFRDATITALYSHHVIEHLPGLETHFAEAFRCMAPGGVYRVGGPNGDGAIAKFIQGDPKWFGDWPDNRRSMGGRFENFVFCRAEHLTILTFSYLNELLGNAGFIDMKQRLPINDTGFPELFSDAMKMEWEDDFETPHTLLIEARKPF